MSAAPPRGGPAYAQVHGFVPLLRAYRRARRAKRGKGGEPAFYRDLEANLLKLSAELASRRWRPRPYRYFELNNKKRRMVSEAAFTDRVVHHALVHAIEPVWEAGFADQSYACRKGRGVHAAVQRAHALARRFRYALRMDVRRYFDSVDHQILMSALGARLLDRGILWLCDTILAHAAVPGVPSGERRGIPIGNLTSQFWANVYLDPVDHLLGGVVGAGRVLRYMDDILVFGDDKAVLWEAAAGGRALLEDGLRLTVKRSATVVAPVRDGVQWLGFRVFPGIVRLDRVGAVRLARRVRASMRRADFSPLQEAAEVGRAGSAIGHAAHADTLAFRRSVVCRLLDDRRAASTRSGREGADLS